MWEEGEMVTGEGGTWNCEIILKHPQVATPPMVTCLLFQGRDLFDRQLASRLNLRLAQLSFSTVP